ncbi:aspartate aminotransferase family protein [Thermotoga profunda]|uniref:aspartate aminotransferase family protein n=1 Tax=Thermotoga profunda TaxID=1508420 RepID=UPI000597E260|nr:aminotransferase class III-fold pyridoxal phosphate-dependent enzyme [Thermotoga profunda]
MNHLCGVYKPFDLQIDHAQGIYIYTKDGKKFIDTFSGIGVLAFGHCDRDIENAMIQKMKRYTHISNFFLDEDTETVAMNLIQRTRRQGKVFFSNSGAEANEAALKAIKKLKKGTIIAFEQDFHGRTLGSLSITGFPNLREPFTPLLPDIVFLPHNNPELFRQFVEQNQIAGVFVESLLGTGGLKSISNNMARTIMEMKEKKGFLLVADEVQSGLGRTGRFFCYEHFGLKPDIITVAKALGGGLPLGATIFLDEIMDVFKYSEHGSTFAPNPVALAGASVVLKKIDDTLISQVRQKGEYLKNELKFINNGLVKEVRGLGLMIGVEVSVDPERLKQVAFKNGLLLNIVNRNVVRFLPPLNIDYKEIDMIVELFENSIKEVDFERNRIETSFASKA